MIMVVFQELKILNLVFRKLDRSKLHHLKQNIQYLLIISHDIIATIFDGNTIKFAAHTTNYYYSKLNEAIDYYYP